MREIFVSIRSYFKVLPFVLRNGISSFFVLPIILNSVLLGSLFYVAMSASSSFEEWVSSLMMNADWIAGDWISFALKIGLSYLLKVILFYLVWQFYQPLSLIFLSPLFSYLSEQVQESLSGVNHEFSAAQFMKDVIRGVVIAIRNITYQILWVIVLYLFTMFVPIFAPFLPIALFLVAAYYYGFTMIDYRSEVFRMSPKESRAFVKKHRYLALGNGIVFQFILLIPVVGTLFAPSFALVAAALGVEELYKDVPRIEQGV